MKLLIITQKVDKNDPILGFFHRWIEEFSKHWESIAVICLYKGVCELPQNVRVLSLGKEGGESKLKYIANFFKYIWNERKNYDKVFVHMNQEYILLGGLLWKLFNKDVFMWRNHHSGSFLTDIAASFCTKVFCTSRFSFTAKYTKTVFMPVGVDVVNFKPPTESVRIPKSILSLGRISPSKNIDVLVDAVEKITIPTMTVDIYGDALPHDHEYLTKLKERVGKNISFYKGIPNIETVKVYSTHDIFVNLSSSGMYDKTIFEAMACGCLILASNENLRGKIPDDFIFANRSVEELTTKLTLLLNYSEQERAQASEKLQTFARQHSLESLGEKLATEIKG
jgi:glycosyltransferase involved in cell wall biosynthesis